MGFVFLIGSPVCFYSFIHTSYLFASYWHSHVYCYSLTLSFLFPFFFVLLHFLYRLDGRHVVFGEVLEGMDVVKMIEGLGSNDGTVKTPVVIADSGELK